MTTQTPLSNSTPTVHMGLPSPGTDFIDFNLDLNSYLVKNPTSTFFMQMDSNALSRFGFYNKDILVIDRSVLNPKKSQVFEIDGQFKIITPHQKPPEDAVFWGTITGLIRKI